jgi:hypothetical protein
VFVSETVRGLAAAFNPLARFFRDVLGEPLGGLDASSLDLGSLGSALNGLLFPSIRPKDDPFVTGVSSVGGTGETQLGDVTSVLLRIFEQGGLDLAEVGPGGSIADPAALEDVLENLDGTIGNVDDPILTDRASDPDSNPDIFFANVNIEDFELAGISRLDIEADVIGGGEVDLTGELEVAATLDLHFGFGVDAHGFFLTKNTAGDPLVSIDNVRVNGEVDGSGRLGFLGVDVTAGSLTLDPDVAVNLSLNTSNDLRLSDLGTGNVTNLIMAEVDGNPEDGNNDDAVFTATFEVSALLPGVPSGITLAAVELDLVWADLAVPDSVEVTAGTFGPAADFLNFLDLGATEVLAALTQLQAQLDAFGVDLPFVDKHLHQVSDLVGTFQTKILDPVQGVLNGETKIPTVQEVARSLAEGLGLDLEALGLAYDQASTELTYDLTIDASFDTTANLDDLGLPDLLDDDGTQSLADTSAGVNIDLTVGVDITDFLTTGDPRDYFFIRDPSLGGTVSVDVSGVQLGATLGAVEIGLDGDVGVDLSVSLGLAESAAANGNGRLDLGELEDGDFVVDNLNIFASASASGLSLAVDDFLSVSGTVAITVATIESVDVVDAVGTPETLTDATLYAVGASDVTGYVGFNAGTPQAVGFNLAVDSFTLALIQPEDPVVDNRSWVGTHTRVSNATFTSDDFTLSSTDLDVSLNIGSGTNTVVDFTSVDLNGDGADLLLNVPTGPSSSEDLVFTGPIFQASGGLHIEIGDFFFADASASLVRQTTDVDLDGGGVDLTGAPLLFIGATLDRAFAGIDGPYVLDEGDPADLTDDTLNPESIGVMAQDGAFGLAILRTPANASSPDTRTWTAVKASLGGLDLVGVDDVTLNATSLAVEVNTASGDTLGNGSGTAAIALDWGVVLDFDGVAGFGDVLEFDPDAVETGDEVRIDLAAGERFGTSSRLAVHSASRNPAPSC